MNSYDDKMRALALTAEGVMWGEFRLEVTDATTCLPGSSVRISRLNTRVSKRELWIIFELFGNLLDIQINSTVCHLSLSPGQNTYCSRFFLKCIRRSDRWARLRVGM